MAVKIRLTRMGAKKRPFYRIVAADERMPRDGRFIEILGYYNPLTDPADFNIDEGKLYKWLNEGAKPAPNTAMILRKHHLLEKWQMLRSGLTLSEVEAKVEQLRAKQPKAKVKEKVTISKKARAAAKAAEEAKAKAGKETAKGAAEDGSAGGPEAGEATPGA